MNTSNFIVLTVEWCQRERLWGLYPSVLRMLAWMVEEGSHELQTTIIFGGRGYALNEARANALNTVNIDPSKVRHARCRTCDGTAVAPLDLPRAPPQVADLGIIRLIFCGQVRSRSTRPFPSAPAPSMTCSAAHRTPAPPPLTTDSTVALGSRTRPVRKLITRIRCGRLAPPASA